MKLLAQIIQEYLKDNHPGWTITISHPLPIMILSAPLYLKYRYTPCQPKIMLDTKYNTIFNTYTAHKALYADQTLLQQITKTINQIERL